jgi:hypothetical protein
MTVEALLIIIGFCLFACYLVYKWQESVVDMAVPPYQEPVKPDMAEQWVAATKADTLDNIDNWNAKVGDKIWHKEAAAELEPTPLNPKAAWPFPSGPKP